MSAISATPSEFRLYHNDGDPRKIIKRKLKQSLIKAKLYDPGTTSMKLERRRVSMRKLDEASEILTLSLMHLNKPYSDSDEVGADRMSSFDWYLKSIDWRLHADSSIQSTSLSTSAPQLFLARN